MPETDFLLASEDQRDLFRFLLERGATFVPSLRYTGESYLTLSTLDAIERVVESGELVGPFLVLPSGAASYPLQMDPIELKAIEWQGQTRFFIRDRYGGPYLDLGPSSTRLRSEGALLCSGFVSYYRDYMTVDQGKVPVSQSVKDLYRSAVSFLQRSCFGYVTPRTRRTYWIGNGAKTIIKSGSATNIPGIEIGFRNEQM